jgi:hypothetical protein
MSDPFGPSSATGATPFWQRMPRFFAFPAYLGPLLRNLAASAACSLAFWAAARSLSDTPLRALAIVALAWSAASFAVARYGMVVIERSAAGYLHPGRYPTHLQDSGAARAVKMSVIFLAVPILIAVVSALLRSPAVMLLLMFAFAAMLPAATMTLTSTDSLAEALDPARCWRTARHIGAPYAVLCVFLLLLLIGSNQAVEWILPRLAPGAATLRRAAASGQTPQQLMAAAAGTFAAIGFSLAFVGNWFFLTMCALVGYVMYQYSEALGLTVVGPGEGGSRGRLGAQAHVRRTRDALVGQMVARGEIREAIEMLNADLADRPADLSLHLRLHRLLLAEGAQARIEDHAQRYLELLTKSGNLREALDLVEQMVQRFPSFEPQPADRLVPLARAALEHSRLKLATHLVRGFDQRFRGHPDVPSAYLLAAQILLHAGQGEARAQRMFEYVVAKFPDTPAAAEARRLLARRVPGASPGAAAAKNAPVPAASGGRPDLGAGPGPG